MLCSFLDIQSNSSITSNSHLTSALLLVNAAVGVLLFVVNNGHFPIDSDKIALLTGNMLPSSSIDAMSRWFLKSSRDQDGGSGDVIVSLFGGLLSLFVDHAVILLLDICVAFSSILIWVSVSLFYPSHASVDKTGISVSR